MIVAHVGASSVTAKFYPTYRNLSGEAPQTRFVNKNGQLTGRRSDARGTTTCRASLVTDNPGLPRAPPGAQYRGRPPATHPPLPTTFRKGRAVKRRRGTRLHCRRSVSVSRLFPSQMQRGGSSAGGNPVRQLHQAGTSTVGRPSSVASKGWAAAA